MKRRNALRLLRLRHAPHTPPARCRASRRSAKQAEFLHHHQMRQRHSGRTAIAGLKITHWIGAVPALLPSEQLYEVFNGESGVHYDAAERAGSKPLVLGYNGPGVRLVAAQNHVATRLAAEDEPSALKGGADLKAGHIGWQFSHVAISREYKVSAYAATISTNSLPASVGMGSPASRQSST